MISFGWVRLMASGIRITQAGVPIQKAADYQEVMDDRWPVVEMLYMDILDLQNIQSDAAGTIAYVPIYEHNLGYLPAFLFKSISHNVQTFGDVLINSIFADNNFIYVRVLKSPGEVVSINLKAFLFIIDRDCSKPYQSDIDITTAGQSSGPSAYGLKVMSRPTSRGMKEKDKSKYEFNTNAKAFPVQQTGRQTAVTGITAYQLKIDHFLGYPPTYFIAPIKTRVGPADPFNGREMISSLSNGGGIAKNTSSTLTVRGAQSPLTGDYLFVILKDPVDLAK
jgi:hypothetical protein